MVLQKVRFEPLQGQLSDYHLYALLSPHLANCGYGNTGWIGDYKGFPMFFAEHDGANLALASSAPWKKTSVGFVGTSDGWQDLSQHFQMEWEYTRAENGNIAFTGEIDLAACNGEFVLALGFGSIWTEAGQQARSTLFEDYAETRQHYVSQWRNWQNTLLKLDEPLRQCDLYRASTAVLRTHESKDFLGGIIASLSIPWGFNKGDEDLGGYHLVWPRDLVETAGALLAAGAVTDAVRVLRYLEATQEADGNWAQNLWLDGRPYWSGIQMDETAFPILLLDLLRREAPEALGKLDRWWPMVRKAASFILRNGPVTQQDRWEEDAGYSPFTLAAEISALLAGADIADLTGHSNRLRPCATPPTPGTTTSSAGSMPPEAIWRSNSASTATTCASPRPTPTAPPRPPKASSPSRIVRRARMASAPITSSAPTLSRWCALACARPMIRAF